MHADDFHMLAAAANCSAGSTCKRRGRIVKRPWGLAIAGEGAGKAGGCVRKVLVMHVQTPGIGLFSDRGGVQSLRNARASLARNPARQDGPSDWRVSGIESPGKSRKV